MAAPYKTTAAQVNKALKAAGITDVIVGRIDNRIQLVFASDGQTPVFKQNVLFGHAKLAGLYQFNYGTVDQWLEVVKLALAEKN